jgi:uncharacterized protein (TIRG00374 family)
MLVREFSLSLCVRGLLTNRRLWIGTAVTAGFLVLLYLRFDFSGMGAALADAEYVFLVPAIGSYFLFLYFRALRWRNLLEPFAPTRTNRLFPVVLVGYTANAVLPMRLGDLVQAYYLSTREPVRVSTVLATLLIERVFDGITLLFFLAATAAFLPIPGLAESIGDSAGLPPWSLAAIVVVPFTIVLWLMMLAAIYPAVFLSRAEWVTGKLPDRLAHKAFELVHLFIRGFAGLHRPARFFAVFLLSLPVWLAAAGSYFFVGLAFDMRAEVDNVALMFAVVAVVASISTLAGSIPSSQGSIGPFEFFTVATLVFLGVSPGFAIAFALVVHLAQLVPTVIAGLLYVLAKGISMRQLTESAREPG